MGAGLGYNNIGVVIVVVVVVVDSLENINTSLMQLIISTSSHIACTNYHGTYPIISTEPSDTIDFVIQY